MMREVLYIMCMMDVSREVDKFNNRAKVLALKSLAYIFPDKAEEYTIEFW